VADASWRQLEAVRLRARRSVRQPIYAVHFLIPTASSSVTTQIIPFEVYVLLTVALAVAFNPAQKAPLELRFTSFRVLGLAFVAWLGIVASCVVIYLGFQGKTT